MTSYQNVILGGGLVAGYAAQAFAEEGIRPGQLAILSAEKTLPYDRPPLSKDFLMGETSSEEILINEPSFYDENNIDLYLNNPAVRVDLVGRQIFLADGRQISFERLLIATGSRVDRLDIPGSNLEDLFYLRELGDARRIRSAARRAKRAIVIGGSFIGMEVAAGLRHYDVETTLVFPEKRVWQSFFTPLMSKFFENYFRQKKVNFLTGTKIDRFIGQNKVQAVQISREGQFDELAADMVVAGIGVEPNVELFRNTEVAIEDGILVDPFLETNVDGVFAAGDLARYPDQIFDRFRRVEHWDNAVTQGRHVARVMLGHREPYVHVPYFFSDVFDLSYEFWGDTGRADVIVHRGDIEKGRFSVWWLANNRLQAAFVMDRPDEERELAPTWIESQQPLSAEMLADVDQQLADLTRVTA